MGEVINIEDAKFWSERKKIEKKFTANGKITHEGVMELYQHASKNGKAMEMYFPEDWGTDAWEERD